MERVFERYNVYCCIGCHKDVLKQLENSVVMPIRLGNCCTTYDIRNHLMGKKVYGIHVTAYVNGKEQTWKFTNDSRRRIIKEINNNFLK